MNRLDDTAVQLKRALNVGVPKEGDAGARSNQLRSRIFRGHHVTIFIIRRAVHILNACDSFHPDRTFGQISQPGEMFAVDPSAVPQRRDTCNWVEIFYRVDASDYLVMVAANKNSRQCARTFRHLIGAGAITDDVSEVDSCIGRRSRGQTSFQSFQIAVNVTEEKYAQSLPDSVLCKNS